MQSNLVVSITQSVLPHICTELEAMLFKLHGKFNWSREADSRVGAHSSKFWKFGQKGALSQDYGNTSYGIQ